MSEYTYKVTAAGRVNIIGEHVDYCGGKVFPVALSLKNTVYVRPNGTDRINISWTTLPDTVSLDVNRLESYNGLKYGNYQAGAALMWQRAGHKALGCDMLQDCTVPFGSGLSSSAAIEVSTIAALACISGEKAVLDGCEKLILPGVGAFGAGMEQLAANGLDAYLHMRARDTKMLGICLGMQLLLESSSEEGEHAGLGFIRGRCVRFAEGKVPQIGWNEVRRLQTPLFDGIEEGTRFYFVHSYRAVCGAENTAAVTDYYGEYPSAVFAGNVYGVQFHPEKSGAAGLRLLKDFAGS